jgi:hypothetical protein
MVTSFRTRLQRARRRARALYELALLLLNAAAGE